MKQQLTYKMHPIHEILYSYLRNRIDTCIGSIRKTSIELDKISNEIDLVCISHTKIILNSVYGKFGHMSKYGKDRYGKDRTLDIYKSIETRLRNCKKHRSDRLKIEYHNLTLQFKSLNRLFSRLGCIKLHNGDK